MDDKVNQMKKILVLVAATLTLAACAPAVGTQAWCDQIKAKPKGDLTANEMIDFAQHCVFKTNQES